MQRIWMGLAGLLALAACTAEEPRILSVDVLRDTRDTRGPYEVAIIVRGVSDSDRIELRYSTNDGVLWLPALARSRDGRDDYRVAQIPGQRPGTTVLYYVGAVRNGIVLSTDPPGAMSIAGGFADAAVTPSDAGAVIDAGPSDAAPKPAPLGGDAGTDAGAAADAGPPAPDAAPAPTFYAFRVLSPSGSCRADSDCVLGTEICASGTCRLWSGGCVDTGSGFVCPGGYVCDQSRDPKICVIAAQTCGNDSNCATVEECDLDLHECRARQPCEATSECPAGYECDLTIGLCFR